MGTFGNFTIAVHKEEDGSYYAEVLNLPGCFTAGANEEELNANLREAISSYLASVEKDLPKYQFHTTGGQKLMYA